MVNDVVAFWVWIPRYVYKISSGWHGQGLDEGEAGVINIQFSIGIDDTIGGTVALDTGTGAEASNNKWTNHPAFTFGDVELTGIWVAKFEASPPTDSVCYLAEEYSDEKYDSCNVTTMLPRVVPTFHLGRYIDIGNAFMFKKYGIE